MPRTRARLLALALPLLAALPLAAPRADTLVVCSEASPDFLNSALSTANTSYDVSEQIYDRLVEMETGGSKLVPGLAESWTISDDGLRYTFKLRHGVKWQSNAQFKPTREFNADDVVFTFQRMFDKENPYNKVGNGVFPVFATLVQPVLKSVSKTDDYTAVLELSKPHAPLLNTLTVQPFSISSAEYAAALQKSGKMEQIDQSPIGTGPFSFVQYQKDSLVRFRAFPDFWGKGGGRAAKVDNLVFTITPDASVRYAKLRAGECQVARYPNPADLAGMRANPDIHVQENTIASMSYVAFKTDKKPFSDHRVREALALAIDVDSLVNAVYQGTGTPTGALVSPALWGHADIKPHPYDPARAKALLAEAGYPNGFESSMWAIPVARAYMPNGRRAGEMIQADWAKIGVKVQIVTYEWGEYLRRARQGEGDIVMLGSTWDYPDPSQLLLAWGCDAVKTGRNLSRWCNKEFNDALLKASEVTDQAERAKLYVKQQEVFAQDIPAVLFADVKAAVGVRKNVEGFKLHFLGGQPFGGVSLAK